MDLVADKVPQSAEMAEYRRELRAAMARELHDGPIQSLTEAVLRLERYRAASESSAMQAAISDVEESVRIALLFMRNLIRDLRDEAPDEDVAAQVRDMAARYESSTGVEVTVVVSPRWPELLPMNTALNLIRILQEAVTNAIRHGQATNVLIELGTHDSALTASVSDDGCGIAQDVPPGAGFMGMEERAALLGGSLVIRGREPGTEVRVEVPMG